MRNAKPTLTAFAAALGISKAQASKCAARGMPVDDLEQARQWRLMHLHWKAKTTPAPAQPPPPDPVADTLHRTVPRLFFKPGLIAACVVDAGLDLDGDKTMHMAEALTLAYMSVVDHVTGTDGEYMVGGYAPANSPERAALVLELDALMAEWRQGIF
jgi:hypothetical protein